MEDGIAQEQAGKEDEDDDLLFHGGMSRVSTVGTADPVADFEELLKGDPEKAFKEMQAKIVQLIEYGRCVCDGPSTLVET